MASPEKQEKPPKPERNVLKERLKSFTDSDDAQEILSAFKEIKEMFKEELEDQKLYKLLSKKDDLNNFKVKQFCKAVESKVNKTEFKEAAKRNLKDRQALVVGGGPCGLRIAIEFALLDMKSVVVEKRTEFTRHSVLQLWLFIVEDLKAIGFKAFYPTFGLEDRLHVSIRRLQIELLKMCLLLGVEVHLGVEFTGVIPPDEKTDGWRATFGELNESHRALRDFEFEVLIIANGRQDPKVPDVGFEWVREERKLAIALAANFENRRTTAHFGIDDIGGKCVMRQLDFFTDIKDVTKADLENLVYIRGETHYFVMTGKKANLIKKGVLKKGKNSIHAKLDGFKPYKSVSSLPRCEVHSQQLALEVYKQDLSQREILGKSNIDRDNLKKFVTEIAAHCTKGGIELNVIDADIFEFTSRAHAKEAAILKEPQKGNTLIIGLVGDTLKQPFWPQGVGIAHGYFSVFDTVWMVYEWLGLNLPADEVLQNRKDTYGCLKVITDKNMEAIKDHGINPLKRYAKYYDRPAGAAENVEPEIVNAREDDDDDESPKVDVARQGNVSEIAGKFGGQKGKRGKDKKKKNDGKKKRRWFSFRRKSKTSKKESKVENGASAEDERRGAELRDSESKRGKFSSFVRRSFRRKKREPRVEEVKDDRDEDKGKPGKSKEPAKNDDKDKPSEPKP